MFLLNFIQTLKTLKIKLILKSDYFVNVNLINGLIIIHPIFMYITYVLFICVYFYFKKFNKKPNLLLKFIQSKKVFFNLFSFFALFLGSYWAQQELNWGGWWNWDFVELISFLFFIKSVYLLHININKNLNILVLLYLNSINFLILFFVLVRIDILNSIHSFNSLNFLNLNLNILTLVYILYIFFIFIKKIKNMYKYIYINKKLVIIKLNLIITSFLLMYILYNIYISYYYNIQLIELTKYIKNIFIYLIFIHLLQNVLFFKKNNIILLMLCFYNNIYMLYYILIIKLHYLIKILNNKFNYKNINHKYIWLSILYIILKSNIFINYYINLDCILYNLNLYNNLTILSKNNSTLFFDSIVINNNLINQYYHNIFNFFQKIYNEVILNNFLVFNNNLFIIYKIDHLTINVFYNTIYLLLLPIYFIIFYLLINFLIKKFKLFKLIFKL